MARSIFKSPDSALLLPESTRNGVYIRPYSCDGNMRLLGWLEWRWRRFRVRRCGGSSDFIELIYVNPTIFNNEEVNRVRPSIKNWDSDSLKAREYAEIDIGGFVLDNVTIVEGPVEMDLKKKHKLSLKKRRRSLKKEFNEEFGDESTVDDVFENGHSKLKLLVLVYHLYQSSPADCTKALKSRT